MMSPEQFVDVEGCFSVRDLGGYRTTDGRQIRSRTVYRADALHRATPRGAKVLEDLGINTVLDLRSPAEVKRLRWEGRPGSAIRYMHVPLLDTVPDWSGVDEAAQHDPEIAVEHYRRIVETGLGQIAHVFALLASGDTLPAAFHCVAGKDRTGIVAALLLRLLDVGATVEAEDYALSELATARWEDAMTAGGIDDTQTGYAFVPEAMLRADASVMIKFLAWMDASYGSAGGALASAGLPDRDVDRLRSKLRVAG